jgi:hypothetical protein
MDYKNSETLQACIELIDQLQIKPFVSLDLEELPKAAIINNDIITFLNYKGKILFENSDIIYEIQENIAINHHDYVMKNFKVIFYEKSPLENYAEFLLYVWRIKKYFDITLEEKEIKNLLANQNVYLKYVLYKIAEFEDILKYLDGTVPTQAQVLMQKYKELEYPEKEKIIKEFNACNHFVE